MRVLEHPSAEALLTLDEFFTGFGDSRPLFERVQALMEKCVKSRSFWPPGDSRRKLLVYGAAIFALFFGLYFLLSMALARTVAFGEFDILFEMDTPRVIDDMTMFWAKHYRTKVHPLYVLLMNPPGVLLKWALDAKVTAAALLNSLLGAAGTTLGFFFFRLFTRTSFDAGLLAALFGVSASQLVLATVPDTASLAVCSLLVTYIIFGLSLRGRRRPLWLWILAGVFSLGVTTTNFAQTAICFGISSYIAEGRGGWRRWVSRGLVFLAGVLAITAALALLQKAIYPTTNLFFLPRVYREDLGYASLLVFKEPLAVIPLLLRHTALVNVIAPNPVMYTISESQYPAVTFSRALAFSAAGVVGLVVWLGLWAARVFPKRDSGDAAPVSRAVTRPLLLGLALCLLFNLALHSFYGVGEKGQSEYFLYTGNFTFLVLALWAIPLRLPQKITRAALLALVAGLAVNNLLVIQQIIAVYAGFST